MAELKTNLILRTLAFITGALMLGMALFDIVFLSSLELWVGFFIGPLFLYYSVKGNNGLLKYRWLSRYGRKFND
jgi:hypothetical protein